MFDDIFGSREELARLREQRQTKADDDSKVREPLFVIEPVSEAEKEKLEEKMKEVRKKPNRWFTFLRL